MLQPLPLSRSVSVEPPAVPLEALLLYLENRRSGGGKVAAVRRGSDGGAIVTFRQRGGEERPRTGSREGKRWGGAGLGGLGSPAQLGGPGVIGPN